MLTRNQLSTLLIDLESDRIERTESTSKTDKFGEAICAFANDLPNHRQPGYLLIGVKDNGQRSGLKITDDLLKNLGAIRSDGNVLPQPVMNVAHFNFNDGDVAVVEVLPSDLPPVRYKGRVWVRVGPRKGIANEQEERILTERRIALARSFDARPCSESTINDLSLGQFEAYRHEAIDPETIAANQRSTEQQLGSLHFFNPERGCPTHAGILLFGKNPRYFLPGAYVQYLKFPGSDIAQIPENQAEIVGDLRIVLRELELRTKVLIQKNLRSISGFQEKISPDYPEWALRELLMNAVMHRNYESNTPIRFYVFDDRIEIMNPGGLYGEATRENFPTRNSYRNPIIAEAMKIMGFVNRFGYGVQRAQALLEANGNPPAQFEFDERSVLVKVSRKPE
ncbi:MAG: putative DNA binding domain-containing protein [Candidatus Competibacter sp.]|nr:putative DNA binding domain-containing protein [Candidatus Competibacter sp.]